VLPSCCRSCCSRRHSPSQACRASRASWCSTSRRTSRAFFCSCSGRRFRDWGTGVYSGKTRVSSSTAEGGKAGLIRAGWQAYVWSQITASHFTYRKPDHSFHNSEARSQLQRSWSHLPPPLLAISASLYVSVTTETVPFCLFPSWNDLCMHTHSPKLLTPTQMASHLQAP
jgi:hypothetical protein